ncbi:MAG: type II toxin-antitoxin system HigB family toxin [Sumerlaeia bacterium]
MRIIARRRLREFWEAHPVAKADPSLRTALDEWYRLVRQEEWTTPAEVKARFGAVSIVANCRAVFNICGNKFRLVASIDYPGGIVYIKFIGTHKEYDAIDVETVE